jgi:serine/threonine protein kinase
MQVANGEHGVGDTLGWALEHYVILKPIASGRFGSVYHARHATADNHVALKLIPRQGPDGEEKVAAERHGAMLQQHFSQAHKGMVPEVFEHGTMGAFYGIAMEFVDGQQLTDLLKAGPLAKEKAAGIGLAICQFLERAHQFKTTIEDVPYEFIVHADLKPDHILILDESRIRVLDFGIAKALEARSLVTTNKWGSVQYASPERLQSDGHVDRHTDFWSLGVMLFEMAAGYRPYRRHEYSLSRLDRAIRTLEPPEPLPADVDPDLGAIVRKLLAPQIERRYNSATAIAADLEACLQGRPTIAGAEQTRAGQETIRVDRKNGGVVPPPLPPSALPPPLPPTAQAVPAAASTAASSGGSASAASRAAAATSQASRKAARPRGLRRLLKFVAIAFLLITATRECDGVMRAQHMLAEIGMLEPSDVGEARTRYASIADAGPLQLGAKRLVAPLKDRMMELADRTILDYRTESPTVVEAHWQRARASLDLARELSPYDREVAAKHSYVQGHLTRIGAKTRDDADRAIRQFRESARLDSSVPDAYLGLATMAAYVTLDLESLRQAIEAAESRGYTSGRRERAQYGDVHKALADRARTNAGRESGASRLEQLQQAAANYEKCVEYFSGLNYFDSDTNLLACRRRLEGVNDQINEITAGSGFFFEWQPR